MDEGKGPNPYFEGWYDGELGYMRDLRLQLVKERDELRAYADALNARCIADAPDAERYRWLKERMLAADFDYTSERLQVLVFEMPEGFRASADCDWTIDEAMRVAPAVGAA